MTTLRETIATSKLERVRSLLKNWGPPAIADEIKGGPHLIRPRPLSIVADLQPDGLRGAKAGGIESRQGSVSRLFRRLLVEALRTAFDAGGLKFFGDLAGLAETAAFTRMLAEVRRLAWVVYGKPPFGGPEQVLAYLGRYTHRVAIANSRLISMDDDRVAFRWRDSRHGGRARIMTLDAYEFIRRFLLHTLPDIRHYGFLANGHRTARHDLCRRLLARPQQNAPVPDAESVAVAATHRCPCCGGPMSTLAVWRCGQEPPRPGTTPHDRSQCVRIDMLRRRHGRRNANSRPIAQRRKQPGW